MTMTSYAAGDHLNSSDFDRLARFIEGYSGIRMPPTKRVMVEGRLRRRVRDLGLAGLHEYCRLLFDGDRLETEAIHLIDAVSTNKTDFFREEQHFVFLVREVLPTLANCGTRRGGDRPLKVWSAACSTGAEPYTLAIVLDDMRRRNRNFDFSILGTDICTEALAKAKLAIYPEEMIAPVATEWQRCYFLRSREPQNRTVRLVPRIRQAVRFGRLNLMDETYPVDPQPSPHITR